MTLTEFLAQDGAPKAAALARQCGVSRTHMLRLRDGLRLPSLKLALKIERLTDEEVPVESWVEDDELEAA